MNQQDPIKIGNIVPRCILTATQVGYRDSSEERLTKFLRPFNYTDILIILARINLLFQRSDNLLECENILRENFCSSYLLDRINNRKGLAGRVIFHRESTLHLLSKSVCVTDSGSTRTPDFTGDAKKKLANCYLIANEFIGPKENDGGTDSTEEQREEALVKLITSLEYAIMPSATLRLKNTLVRSKEFLARFQKMPATFDVNETFFQATGLTLQDYQHLIFGILVEVLKVPPAEILTTEVLCVDTKRYPTLTPLYGKLLPHTCISIDELARRAVMPPSLSNDFLLWKQNPLVKISEDQILCIDIGFLADKLETGVFWTIRNQLERNKTGRGQEIIQLRGDVFEDYTASIIERGINAQIPPRMEQCIIQPEYIEGKGKQRPDIAVCGHETLILLECKAPLLSAETKLSGDFCTFYTEIKNKIIKRKGIEQLWNAIQALGHTNKAERCRVEGIDIFRVKRIYPVLVLSDYLFALPLMNWFLDSEFQRFVNRNNLEDHLEIMPLTVLTIDDLEFLEPYLSDKPLHVHLDKWITQFFKHSDSSSFNEYFRSLVQRDARENTYIDQEFNQIVNDIMKYFLPRGIN